MVGCLTDFVYEEIEHGRQRRNCEQFLQKSYDHIPREELTHPVFALLDFPSFDMGIVEAFSGSVWSKTE